MDRVQFRWKFADLFKDERMSGVIAYSLINLCNCNNKEVNSKSKFLIFFKEFELSWKAASL